ncbi:MAG: DUF362 domain-containing protein [Bacteroidota bacterium]|nr:DUF362 domain-containing protein [Bacteroidota bacterium]
MERRDFLFKGIGAGLVAGLAISTDMFAANFNKLPTASSSALKPYDLVAVMGGEPEVMFEKGIAALGGMKAFVKKGQTVVIKPNIGWDATPERGANTNPKLIGKIVEHCFRAGAKDVFVFDNTCDNWQKCYTNSGIEKAVKDAGGKMVTGKSDGMYKEVNIPKGVKLKKARVHELILNSDVFINVPVLKHHGGAMISVSMKNLMGIVADRGFWHKNDLQQCIADLPTWRKPDLNIVDAYRVMKTNGPRGVSVSDISIMKAQFISRDIVAVDTAAAKTFGLDPKTVGHIVKAQEHGLGSMSLEKLNINRIKI